MYLNRLIHKNFVYFLYQKKLLFYSTSKKTNKHI